MKIQVHARSRTLRILLPTCLVLNKITASLAGRRLSEHGVPELSKKTLAMLVREARRWKKKHPAWQLALIETKKGEQIKIVL